MQELAEALPGSIGVVVEGIPGHPEAQDAVHEGRPGGVRRRRGSDGHGERYGRPHEGGEIAAHRIAGDPDPVALAAQVGDQGPSLDHGRSAHDGEFGGGGEGAVVVGVGAPIPVERVLEHHRGDPPVGEDPGELASRAVSMVVPGGHEDADPIGIPLGSDHAGSGDPGGGGKSLGRALEDEVSHRQSPGSAGGARPHIDRRGRWWGADDGAVPIDHVAIAPPIAEHPALGWGAGQGRRRRSIQPVHGARQ